MRRRLTEYAMTAACNLMCAGVVVMLALVAASWLLRVEAANGIVPKCDAPSSTASKSRVETTRVRMEIGSGRPFSLYRLEDEAGRELVRVTYGREGFIVINLGEVFPLRPGFSARIDGSYEFALTHEGVDHRLKVGPDGASGFQVISRSQPTVDPALKPSGGGASLNEPSAAEPLPAPEVVTSPLPRSEPPAAPVR